MTDAKEIFLRIWDRQAQTTARVIRAFAPESLEFKAHERLPSIRDLAWQCVIDKRVIDRIIEGASDLRNVPPRPPPPETGQKRSSARA